MKRLLFVLLTLLGAQAQAKFQSAPPAIFTKGFVQVRPNQRLYVEYRKATFGRPTLFLLNGLTWSTTQWGPFVTSLNKLDPGLGIVLYDMEGMGKTLLDKAPINFEIPIEHQVQDLKDLHDTLKITGPTILSGLSYGGAVALAYMAKYPKEFDKLIAMAPFLERLPDQDAMIQQMIKSTRQAYPFNPASDDELYDYFLRQLVTYQYPILEPIMLENPYKIEGVYRMVQGIKNWHASEIVSQLPAGKVHLMAGEDDPYVKLPWLKTLWQSLSQAARASFIILSNTQHKLPEERPDFTAAWVQQILNNNPDLKKGLVFDGDPAAGVATSGSVVIPLHKASLCDTLLRTMFRPF